MDDEGSTAAGLSTRLRSTRKRRGLSQKELAELAGVSKSLVSKIEQDIAGETRLETVRKLAVALRVSTTHLIGGRGDAEPESTTTDHLAIWRATYRALLGQLPPPEEQPTVEGVRAALEALKPMLADNRYREIATLMPSLLRDAELLNGGGRAIRSRALNATGWIFTQTRQFAMAELTLHQAIDAADDRLDAAAAVNTLVWLHLRQGQLDAARRLATKWADDIEPRFSRATMHELTLWGRLLLGISNAAIRDVRPGEAEDSIKLAHAAATRIGHEVIADTSTTRTFGPLTVAMIRAENAAILDQPDKVLAIADRIPVTMLHARSASRCRHQLDVASALTSTRRHAEALAVMQNLARVSPEWLSTQRYARDTLGRIINRRRTLTDEMQRLADAVGLAF